VTDILCQRCAAILAGMRADRLLALLAMLQARGKCAARELATELEVSVRTVYRDIDALSAAGIPVWATGGPGGGCQLMEGWRSPLLGISTEEAMALLAAAAPAPLADTSLAEDLSAARLKLLAALPAARRAEVAAESARFYVDAPDWFRPLRPAPHLDTIVQSVRAVRRLRLVYHRDGRAPRRLEVEPLGLVAKAGNWYVVARSRHRIAVYRVDRVVEAELLPDRFARPVGFELAVFWTDWSREFETSRPSLTVKVRIHPGLWDALPQIFGEAVGARMDAGSPPDGNGWRVIELTFESPAAARTRILGLGPEAEVVEPNEIREAVRAAATATAALYAVQAIPGRK
jgi:predicted DNA-binding transcriptional regulator YafY